MTTIILICIGLLIFWEIRRGKKIEDHTSDPLSVPCPCCQTASIAGAMGYYRCPSCKSQWLPKGTWVLRFECDCGSRPVKITQDYYNEDLFLLKFSCGRISRYNHSTKAKCDTTPCRHVLKESLQEKITFTSNSTVEEECGTPVQQDEDGYNFPDEPIDGPPPMNENFIG